MLTMLALSRTKKLANFLSIFLANSIFFFSLSKNRWGKSTHIMQKKESLPFPELKKKTFSIFV